MTDNGLALAGHPTTTALDLPGGLAFDDWQETGKTLARMERAVAWWLGDWLNYGEQTYGDKYTQALDLFTDDPDEAKRKYNTLTNWSYVARQVPPRNRDPDLSWSHHRVVAPLDPPEQKVLLSEAKSAGWTKAELEREMKGRKGEEIAEPEDCPTCGRKLPPGGKT